MKLIKQMNTKLFGLDDDFKKLINLFDKGKLPNNFEKFVNEVNINANKLLKEKDIERFKQKYGNKTDNVNFQRQT